MADYRTYLRAKRYQPLKIQRTKKKPGDLVFVWKDGEYQAVKWEAEAA